MPGISRPRAEREASVIKADNLTRRYGDFTAVDGVSFEIPRGQIVGLLGHNGAGKTTIMKCLTGYLEPSAGAVSVAGLDVVENRLSVQQKVGYLPESSPLYPEMPAIQYLDYVCDLRGIAPERRKAAIRAALRRAGLESVALQPAGTLSKGYKQRLGVAQAIIHEPEILILDEPTSGLDPSQIHEMRTLIRDLAKRSTVMISTHILQEVEAICDRVLIILQGRLAADAMLSDLCLSGRLLLEVNRPAEAVAKSLGGFREIKSIKWLSAEGQRHRYLIELGGDGEDAAPRIARTAVQEGWDLYKLDREQRSLETVFREINSGANAAG